MKTPSQNTKIARPSPQRVAVRQKRVRRSGQAQGSSHWLRNGLCAVYILAIVWFSLGRASGDSAITSGAVASVAASATSSATMNSHFPHRGFGRPGFDAVESHLPGAYAAIGSRSDVQGYVHSAARAGGVDPRVAEWIVYHESRHEPHALGDGGDSRGLWQINKVWHPEVSDRCAYDVRCSTRWSIQRIHDGYVNEWSTWKYRKSWFTDAPSSLTAPAK